MNPFVVAVPFRSVCDDQARILSQHGLLRRYFVWNRRGTKGIPSDMARKQPILGFAAYIGAKMLPPYYAEAFRFSLYPLYDQWVKSQLQPGDNIISSYAYANESFKWVRKHGGKTFLDGGNSHPDNFWEILSEEHKRWKCRFPPVPRFYYERCRRMMEDVDYVLSPSDFVSQSFLDRGFKPEQIIPVVYPVDLAMFRPLNDEGTIANGAPRRLNWMEAGGVKTDELRVTSGNRSRRPFTIINTGSLSLRKGTPYLLEAFRLIRKEIPAARLLLTDAVSESIKPILAKYSDLPIEWKPYLAPRQLAERLRSADLFILPSLEEGLVRTALEAMACGLPVILTPNTGTAQYVREGVNGSIVPVRDPKVIAAAALEWHEKLASGWSVSPSGVLEKLTVYELEQRLAPLFVTNN